MTTMTITETVITDLPVLTAPDQATQAAMALTMTMAPEPATPETTARVIMAQDRPTAPALWVLAPQDMALQGMAQAHMALAIPHHPTMDPTEAVTPQTATEATVTALTTTETGTMTAGSLIRQAMK